MHRDVLLAEHETVAEPGSFTNKPQTRGALQPEDLQAYVRSWGMQSPMNDVLFLTSCDGNLPMMKYVAEQLPKSDFARASPIGLTMLQNASRLNARHMVEYLLRRVDVAHINHVSGSSGVSALTDAAMRGHPEIVSLLLQHGADVAILRKDGRSALHCAAEHGHAECARRLLAAGADAAARDEAGRTPFELVEAWDAKCHAVLAAHHIKQQEATIASLKAELKRAQG